MTRGYVLAIDFGGTKTAIATANEDGEFILQDTFSTSDVGDGAQVLARATEVAGALCDETLRQHPDSPLVAIGVSSMGITFPDRVEMAPNVPGWERLSIEPFLQSAFPGVPIRIENDVKSAAWAELRRGALKGTDVGLYLNIGTGFAIAYTVGDEVVRGHNGAAGEVAYLLVDRETKKGYSSGITPLEDVVGGGAIGRRASLQFGRSLSARDVFRLALTDSDIRVFRDEMLEVLAYHVTNAVVAWDPEKVVVGGGMVAAKGVIFPLLQEYFKEFVPFPPVLEESAFQDGASIFGAVELARHIVRKGTVR